MSQESDLLFARHALQLGFVEADALKEALHECGGNGLEEELIRRKLLSAEDVEAVRSVVQATLRRKPAAATPAVPVEEAPRAAPRGGDAERGIVGTVMLGRPRPGDRESGHERLSATAAGGAEATREGQIVICLGDDEAGLFPEILSRARVQVSPEDPDLAALPESALPEAAPRDRRLFVSRKRSSGTTLAEAVEAARHGAPGDPSRFTRAARDACIALACAHALGLAHRNLTPSSILLGDHGEVLVTGWEHARFLGAGAGPALPEQEAPFTVAEPCYAAPEIGAAGAIYLADARSDVYSLGAILYLVIAKRPPFFGDTAQDILTKQRAGAPPPPGVSAALGNACLKALAPRRDQRPPHAGALLSALQGALEAGPETRKLVEAADVHVALAHDAVEAYTTAQAEAKFQQLEARRAEVRQGAASEGAKEAVAAAHQAEADAAKALKSAEGALAAAFGLSKNHPAARKLKADLHWAEHLHAEDAGDVKAALVHLQIVAQFNDGAFDVQLRGEGTLSLVTEVYSCACLRAGRPVASAEAVRIGYHAASGRAVEGEIAAEGIRMLEWSRPVTLRAHGKSCEKRAVNGADAWLFRLVSNGPLRVPPTDGRAGTPGDVPPAVSKALFEPDSPFLAAGGQYLGKTPVKRLALPCGSYLIVLTREGSRPVRVPVQVGRCEAVDLKVTLYGPDDIPPGFVQVSQGKFGWQGDRDNGQSLPHEILSLPDIFIARDPVTCREYAEYLNAIAKDNAAQAAARAPRVNPAGPQLWPGPPWTVPADAGPGGRWQLPGTRAPWDPQWPVLGISWEDALQYCAWLRSQKPWFFSLPHELDWEKAARGPDRRRFPWGNGFDLSCCNAEGAFREGPHPAPVKSFPRDESPYGVRGLAGNSRDFCLNSSGADFPEARILRGGYWSATGPQLAATFRSTAATRHVSPKGGFRLVMIPAL